MHASVVIIGAGPAGATVSLSLSKKGIDNILIDKRKTIGVPVQCAEFVGINISRYVPINNIPSVMAQDINFMDIDTGMDIYRFDGRGFMLNRVAFDDFIVKSAVESGAVLIRHSVALKILHNSNTLIVLDLDDNKIREVAYDYLIVATGPKNNFRLKSILKSNLENGSFIYSIQVKGNLLKGSDAAACYFRNYIPYGYGWVFPKGDFANIGIGIQKPVSNVPLQYSLDRFTDELKKSGVITGGVWGKTAGLVPVGGLNDIAVSNIALCGDAAGLTHPITGAGILSAVISGDILGEFLSDSIKKSVNLLGDYKDEIDSIFKKPFEKAVLKRNTIYRKMTTPESIDKYINRLWPSF